jgi:hypothetical protein
MSAINIEIKVSAHYAFKAGNEKFGQELVFSELSIDKLENLLKHSYLRFFNLPKYEKTSNVISQIANMWGSYLGVLIRLKQGSIWILKSTERYVYPLMGHCGYRISGFMWHIREIGSSFEHAVT